MKVSPMPLRDVFRPEGYLHLPPREKTSPKPTGTFPDNPHPGGGLTAPGKHISCQRMGICISQRSKNEFAAHLKQWRKREKLSQSEAAEWLGVSVRSMQNWEIARTKPASVAEKLILHMIAQPKKRRR
jgi:DNA-binding transcriptional regulator YiaG